VAADASGMRNRNHRAIHVLLVLAVAAAGFLPAAAAGASTGKVSTVPSGALGGLRYHVVRSGDTVTSIARTYGVDAATIRAANGIVGDRLYLGARVLIDAANPSLTRSGGSSAATSSSGASSAATASSAGSGTSYVVKDGDVLERIARRHGVKLSALLSANGLEPESLILAGRTLTIPSATATGGAPSGTSADATYLVKDGDVLERIARRFGVKLSALLSANGLEAESLILPGRKLTIPSGASGAAPAAASTPTTTAPAAGGSGSVGPRMVCPVPGASYMNDWGFPRGTERFHEGTDLFASEGTTIVAPVSGTLTFGSNGLGGTTFNITTPDGWVIYGAHLSKAIGSSRQVSAGTAVGLVGDTGGAAGGPPHLHLGIKPAGGRPANPYPSVLAACG